MLRVFLILLIEKNISNRIRKLYLKKDLFKLQIQDHNS